MSIITSSQVQYNENSLYYFKKIVEVDKMCESKVKVFADSRYKLFVNGELVSAGPLKQTSEIKYYDTVDITKHVHTGINEIEVWVLQLSNDKYTSNQNDILLESVIRSGYMVLCLRGNAGNVKIDTDESWKVAKENHIEFFCKPFYNFYNVAELSEKIDENYRKGSVFENAVKVNSIYDMDEETGNALSIAVPAIERTIPNMFFEQKDFISENNGIYDAGKLTCGYIRLKCGGVGKITVTYAECMVFMEDGKIKKRKRDDMNGIVAGNSDILHINGECVFEPFWMRTFRYIEIKTEGDITIEKFDYIETGYPINVSENYDFGNSKDNSLFEISVNTLKRCMHETYMDCPYYEQIQYTMDTYLQIIFTYQLTADKALPEKAIDDFAKSYRVGGLTQSRYPINTTQYIPGFSLFFVLMLYEHAKRFNDKAFIRKYLHIADGIMEWFTSRLDGYMVPRSNFWDFIDWSDGYENGQISEKEPMAVYSLMLAYTLEKADEMHKMIGENISSYGVLAKKIKKEVKQKCFDKETGLYANSPSKKNFAQHQQIWAVLCGLEKGDKAKQILINSMNLTCKSTSSYMFFLFRALEKAGIYEMSEKCMNSLRSLVDLGCTTTPEWIDEDVRSECHAWSAVAIYEFTAKILGVTYRDDTIYIEPYCFGRNFAKGEVATPVGTVYCEWKINDNEFTAEIKLPKKQTALLKMPDGTEIKAVTGKYNCKLKTEN